MNKKVKSTYLDQVMIEYICAILLSCGSKVRRGQPPSLIIHGYQCDK